MKKPHGTGPKDTRGRFSKGETASPLVEDDVVDADSEVNTEDEKTPAEPPKKSVKEVAEQ